MTATLQRTSFPAMGTICGVTATVASHSALLARRALHAAEHEVAACERALSRFDERSDLTRLNRECGSWVVVDERLIEALACAVRARSETCGAFDPTILPALVSAGYDRSFEQLTVRAATPLVGWHPEARIDLDPGSRRARVEHGAAVDLGGIGKGFAATRALEAMRAAWPALAGALVDLGGDIGVFGSPSEGSPWLVDIADPRTPGRVAGTLQLTHGGVATSGRDVRRFGPGGQFHHLIDPATGAPAVAGPLAVTVVARSAGEAEAHATALAVTDVGRIRAYLGARPQLAALVIPQLGDPVAIGDLPLVRERAPARLVITMQSGRTS